VTRIVWHRLRCGKSLAPNYAYSTGVQQPAYDRAQTRPMTDPTGQIVVPDPGFEGKLSLARPIEGSRVATAIARFRPNRIQTVGEEIANAISHGAGALFAIAAIPVLVVDAVAEGDRGVEIFSVAVFGLSMVLLYLASTLYHALPHGTAKHAFRVLDHSAIYLLIAGSYTPFALGVFMDSWGWPMFGLVWGLAGAGVLLKCLKAPIHPALSAAIYVVMGWLALVAIDPLFTELPRMGLAWVVAGGIAYTAGVVFFALDRKVRYAHFTWHLFVLAGTACHFVAVLRYT
jgi:hemolysin III